MSNLIQPPEWYKSLPRKIYSQFEKIDCGDDWFSVYRITECVYAIYEQRHFQEVISYLVTGSEKALLIDTGMGMSDIRKVVEKLCNTEVVLVNTHSHADHIGGNWQFDKAHIYCIPFAVKVLTEGLTHEKVLGNIAPDTIVPPLPAGFDPENYCVKPCNCVPVDESFEVNLGDMTFKLIYTPGHSRDSVMYYCEEKKYLFSGDTYYPATLYAHLKGEDGQGSVFDVYRDSMHKVRERFSSYTVFPSHNEPLRDGHCLTSVAKAFDDISCGNREFVQSGELKKYQFEDFRIITR